MYPLSFHKEYATPGQLTNTSYLFRVLKKLFCLKSQEWDPSLSLSHPLVSSPRPSEELSLTPGPPSQVQVSSVQRPHYPVGFGIQMN